MDLKLTETAKADLPVGTATIVLLKGADAYCAVRPGTEVNLLLKDETLPVSISATSIGPLLNYFNTTMLGQPQHFAMKGSVDGRLVVDALERQYPGDASAIDPRTIYSALTFMLPSADPLLGATVGLTPAPRLAPSA